MPELEVMMGLESSSRHRQADCDWHLWHRFVVVGSSAHMLAPRRLIDRAWMVDGLNY